MVRKTLNLEIIAEDISAEDLKYKLMNLTSDKFNGNAGDQYFNDVFIGDKNFRLSGLDTYMIDFNPDECYCSRLNYIADFIESMFFDNILEEDFDFNILKYDNQIFVSTTA